MSVTQSCPISLKSIDNTIVRTGAFIIFIAVLLYVMFPSVYIPVFLTFDFCLRLFGKQRWSVVGRSAEIITRYLKIAPHFTDEAPKRFAVALGLFISMTILAADLSGMDKIASFFAWILLLCAATEILFDFCIGCKLYYVMKLLKVIKNDRNLD